MSAGDLRARILGLVAEYHAEAFPERPFVPGETAVPVSGRVFDAAELQAVVAAGLDFWLTAGPWAERFERDFAARMGVRSALLVNSGSSANLLAVAALTAPELKERRLQPGDEVLTCAAGFPTTVAPILQHGLVPVYLDAHLPTCNADPDLLEAAVGPRTRAIMLAHTLGNPFDLDRVMALAERHDLWVVEDCCDAVGATWNGRPVGSFGHLATTSFYPAHHLTMGEGGAVLTSDPLLRRLVESFRDWGRDCWCPPGHDDTCRKRYGWQLGDLPAGYDHKYTYGHLGYNLKATDLQAAVGVAQLAKLDGFIARRAANFNHLRGRLAGLQDLLLLPEALPQAVPSWFGFPLTLRPGAGLDRNALVQRLNAARIGTRLLFGGNLLRQPAFRGTPGRVPGPLAVSDRIMHDTFWVGVYPGLTPPMLDHLADTLAGALKAGR